jgi:hypothetical protein
MAKKTKKSVVQIQEALLSNTGLLKPSVENVVEQPSPSEKLIDDDLMEKLEILAQFQKTTPKELINKALSHFIRLKGIELEQAQKLLSK